MDAIAEGRCAAPPLLAAKAVMTSPIRLATVALCCGRGHSHTSISGACCRRCGPGGMTPRGGAFVCFLAGRRKKFIG
jgi:hypothetical protein